MSAKRITLVTGANTGIGYETIKTLLSSDRSYHILLGSRSTEKGAAAAKQFCDDFPSTTSTLEVVQIDVDSDEFIAGEFWPGEVPAAGWPKPVCHFAPTGYRVSKMALSMLVLAWHWTLRGDGVKGWGVSPGQLATNLGGDPGLLRKLGAGDPSLGGQLVRKVLDGERDADADKIVSQTGVQSW